MKKKINNYTDKTSQSTKMKQASPGYSKVRSAFDGITFSVAILFILLGLNAILRPLYLDYLKDSFTLKIIATGQKNKDSKGSNVVIRSVSINAWSQDMSMFEVDPNSGWKYVREDHALVNEDPKGIAAVEIPLDSIQSFSVTLRGTDNAGIAEIYIGDKLWKTVDLYYPHNGYHDDTFNYQTSNWLMPEKNLYLIGALFIVFLAFFYILNKKGWISEKTMRLARIVVICGLIAIILTGAISWIQYNDRKRFLYYLKHSPHTFIKSTAVIFWMMAFISLVTGRVWIADLIISPILYVMVCVDFFKQLFRGFPFYPWDISLFDEALSIVSGYEIKFTKPMILSGILLILIIVALIIFRKKIVFRTCRARWIATVTTLVCLLVSFYFGFFNLGSETKDVKYRTFDPLGYYLRRGFVASFLEFTPYVNGPPKPEGYDHQRMEEINKEVLAIDQKLRKNTDNAKKKPNVIIIMSEAFWDLSRVESVKLEAELMPNFNRLKKESRYGTAFAHVINAGTVISEFECLSGLSGEFFPKDYMVYGHFFRHGFATIVSHMKEQGYHTTGMHPYNGNNYNRAGAYEKMGFDQVLFREQFNENNKMRGYISDEEMTDKIIDVFDKQEGGQPQFIFAVSMMNHGGYSKEQIIEEHQVPYTSDAFKGAAKNAMTDYLAGIHASDAALGKLVEHVRASDRDTIVLFYGDHMSDFWTSDGTMFEHTDWIDEPLKKDFETHQVPFLMWSNFAQKEKNLGIMQTAHLVPTMCQEYSLKSKPFWNFLYDMQKYYTASDDKIVVTQDGTYKPFDQMDAEQRKYYEMYKLIQYDYVYGKRYTDDLIK